MKVETKSFCLLFTSVLCWSTLSQAASTATAPQAMADAGARPQVIGQGVGLFKVGPLLAQDNFENLNIALIVSMITCVA